MKTTIRIVLVAICMMFVTLSYGQRYAVKNGIGIQGGITQFDILTDNFETKSNSGFLGGLSASVDLPHKWYELSYNMQLSENNIDILAETPASATQEYIEYKMFTAQVSFLFHVKLIKDNLTLDLGPMLQYNGELELKDEDKEDYIITNYENLKTQDIANISKFNVNGAIGVSAGINAFQFRAQYVYGFTNILGKLNDEDFNLNNADRFEGNQSLLVFSAILTF